jgi:predicted Zn-dependent protease
MAMRTLRVVLLILAIVACAWYVLAIRQAHDTAAATALLTRGTPLKAAEAARADGLLRAASELNPDQQVAILRAQVAYDRGDRPRAERLLAPVVRDEPENAVAWLWVARAAPDAATFTRALARIGYLVPRLRSSR